MFNVRGFYFSRQRHVFVPLAFYRFGYVRMFFFPNYLFWHLRLEVFSLQSTSKVCWYQQTPSRSDYAVQLRDPRFHVRKFEEERKWNGMECFMIGSNTRQRENNPGKKRSENTPASGVSLNIPSLRPVKSIS